MTQYNGKQRIALRYWLLGKGFTRALEAMDYAESHHDGLRKDGVTPEFAHQVQIAHYLRSLLPWLEHPEETLCVGLLHDVSEDYGVSLHELEQHFGGLVAEATWKLTKEFRGERRDDHALFAAMAGCPVASVVKPADRINNLGTMVGVFTQAKMAAYVTETRELHLPMLKAAKKRFPAQEPAYENAKLVLLNQVNLVEALVAGAGSDPGLRACADTGVSRSAQPRR